MVRPFAAAAVLLLGLLATPAMHVAAADPLPPPLDPLGRVLEQTLRYLQNFNPSDNLTTMQAKSEAYMNGLRGDIFRGLLCFDLKPGTWELPLFFINSSSIDRLSMKVIAVTLDNNGFPTTGYLYIGGTGNGTGCALDFIVWHSPA